MLPAPGGIGGPPGWSPGGSGSHPCVHGGIMRATTSCRDWGRMGPKMPVRSSWARLLLAALALLPVAFVADGRAWATTGDGRRVWCLFEVHNPGPFLWGPRGDRVVLDGLEVRGVGATVWRPPRGIETVSLTWLGATGNALAFVTPGRLNLASAALGSIELRELTPFRGPTYQAVASHPSGQALAFVLKDAGATEVWMASNTGGGQARLVPPTRARLGPLAFSAGGKSLYYGSRQPDGSRHLEVYSLAERRRLEPAWTGDRDILAIVGRRDPAATQLALDTGSGCGNRRADLSGLDGGPGRPLLPSASGPTSAVGWLDTRRVLVVEGGCAGPCRPPPT